MITDEEIPDELRYLRAAMMAQGQAYVRQQREAGEDLSSGASSDSEIILDALMRSECENILDTLEG